MVRGNRLALRDFSTLLSQKNIQPFVSEKLIHRTLFLENGFNENIFKDKNQFLNFYYKNLDSLYFDYILGVFLTKPVAAAREPDFLIRPIKSGFSPDKQFKAAAQTIWNALNTGDTAHIFQSLAFLTQYRTAESESVLLKLVQNPDAIANAPFPNGYNRYVEFTKGLKNFTSDSWMRLLLQWTKNGSISARDAEIPLSILLNHYFSEASSAGLLRTSQALIDSFESLKEIRIQGFYAQNSLRPEFFYEPAEYYAYLTGFLDQSPWAAGNALFELDITKAPSVLYFRAAAAYRKFLTFEGNYTDTSGYYSNYIKPIETVTQLTMLVPDSKGATRAYTFDRVWLRNHLIYWARHYGDYEWDANRNQFINKYRAETLTEEYDRLFRRLTSTNDSIATEAFRQLIQGEPESVLALAEQYRQTIRSFNLSLPSFKYRFLEELTLFNGWMHQNGYVIAPLTEDSREKLEALLEDPEPKRRNELEEAIIKNTSLAQLSNIELEGFMHESNLPFSFSISKIIDQIYNKNWPKIAQNTSELQIYAAKGSFFADIGIIGTCNLYANRFIGASPELRTKIEQLQAAETNERFRRFWQLVLDKIDKPVPPASPVVECPGKSDLEKKLDAEIAALSVLKEVKVEKLNQIMGSPCYVAARHKVSILNSLAMVKPLSQLKQLLPSPKFSLETDLKSFEKCAIPSHDIPAVLRLFSGDAPEKAIQWLQGQMAADNLSAEEKGAIWIEAMRIDWLRRFLTEPAGFAFSAHITAALEAFLAQEEGVSEFDEENAQIYLLLLKDPGATPLQKIEQSIQANLSSITRNKLQREILSTISFADLPALAGILDQLEPDIKGVPGFVFLNRDFGLPPLDFSDAKSKKELEETAKNGSEMDFYTHYLKAFGLDYFSKNKREPNFEQIGHILKEELITPYTGGGGEKRDWAVFSTVKFLEGWFHESLGFHQKLNENQTFYTYNAAKRADAWLKYLVAHQKLSPDFLTPKSWQY